MMYVVKFNSYSLVFPLMLTMFINLLVEDLQNVRNFFEKTRRKRDSLLKTFFIVENVHNKSGFNVERFRDD